MNYVKTNDGRIIGSYMATHELTKTICDAGYYRTLEKGSLCRIGKTWNNFYGRWTSIIDEEGRIYDISFGEVEDVVKELQGADTLEELVDGYVIVDTKNKNSKPKFQEEPWKKPPLHLLKKGYEIYGVIWVGPELHAATKMNSKGKLELKIKKEY